MIKSILAGFVIGIGGTAYLSCDNQYIGAFLFSIGLLLVLMFRFNLYTGKVPYIKLNIGYFKQIGKILVGNIIGAGGLGIILSFTNLQISQKAAVLCNRKLSEGWRIIPLAIMCNILIFFAVEAWKSWGKNLEVDASVRATIVILCVMVFIICGFEHSIANVFYFSLGRVFTLKALLYLIINIIFNGIGGFMIRHAVSQHNKR